MSDQPGTRRYLAVAVSAFAAAGSAVARLRPTLDAAIRACSRALQVATRVLLRIIVLGLVLLPPALVLGLLLSEAWRPAPHVAAMALWIAFSMCLTGVIWTVLWALSRLISRLIRSPALGPSLWPRLAALLLVIAVFPRFVSPTIVGISWSALELALMAPVALIRLSTNALNNAASTASPPVQPDFPVAFDETFILSVANRFAVAVDQTITPAVAAIPARVPLDQLAVAVVVWFLLSLLAREALAHGLLTRHFPTWFGKTSVLVSGAATRLRQHRSLNLSNIGFLLILTTGTFLSMAAITSLPRLRENLRPNADVNADSLRRDLSELQLSDAEIKSYYGDEIPTDIILLESGKSQSIDTSENSSPPTSTPPPTAAVAASTPKGGGADVVAPVKSGPSQQAGATADPETAKQTRPASDGQTEASAETKLRLVAATARLEAARADALSANTALTSLFMNDDFSESNGGASKLRLAADLAMGREREAREALELVNEETRLQALVDQQGNTVRTAWFGLLEQSQSLKKFVSSNEAQSLSYAVREYNVQNIERRGSREEIAHFLKIRAWYVDKIDTHRNALRLCGEQLRRGRAAGATWMSGMRRVLGRAESLSDVYRKQAEVFNETNTVDRMLASDACEIPESALVPASPPLGDSLGPLQFVAGWLLNAASVPLALIVGLVGFGLLGAAISTFVREQFEARLMAGGTDDRHVIVSDLPGVALRGISAAIVVFLAVQGGLAVLSGAGTEPNPYVLLLSCFVAAVFSERVWQRAYDYLRVQLRPGDQARHEAIEILEKKPLELPAAIKAQE